MTRPYELFARFAPDGSVAGVSVRTITTVNGRDYESDPEPLSGTDDPAFVDFAQAFAASAVAERESLRADKQSLQSQLATLADERDSLASNLALTIQQHDQLQTECDAAHSLLSSTTVQLQEAQATITDQAQQIASLQAELDALRNPPGPDLTTRDGVRQWVTDQRFAHETGGIYVGQQFVSTGRDEVGHWFPRFYNAMMWLQGDPRIRAVNPDGRYPFKPKGHPPTVLSAAEVLRVYEVMAWYINACFAAEASLYARLDAGEALDVVMDSAAAVWPGNHFDWQPPQ